ncbi:MAG: PfkB family carbohydrate kinase [Puniceicoccales bacterium]
MNEQPPKPPPLLVAGGLGLDTLLMPDGSERREIGGSGWFASLAAAFFLRPQLFGAVGGDFPLEEREHLERLGVDTTGITVLPHEKTFAWKCRYHQDPDKRKTLELHPNVEESFRPELNASQRRCPYLLLANMRPDFQGRVLEQMEGEPFVALDTIDFWIRERRSELLDMIRRTSLMLLNDEEAALLTGYEDPRQAGRALLELGPRFAVVKLGSRGSLGFSQGKDWHVPAELVDNPVDPTGAGDSYAGALMATLAQCPHPDSEALLEAMQVGARTAAITVQDFSARALIAKLEQRKL